MKKAREDAGLDYPELAKRLGMSDRGKPWQIETGVIKYIRTDIADQWFRACGRRLGMFVREDAADAVADDYPETHRALVDAVLAALPSLDAEDAAWLHQSVLKAVAKPRLKTVE